MIQIFPKLLQKHKKTKLDYINQHFYPMMLEIGKDETIYLPQIKKKKNILFTFFQWKNYKTEKTFSFESGTISHMFLYRFHLLPIELQIEKLFIILLDCL